MVDTLLIRLEKERPAVREWLLLSDQATSGQMPQAGVPGSDVLAEARRVVVLVPGTDVYLDEARVPGRNRQRLLRAIPYALEEKLATDVEQLHFALGAPQDDNAHPVAAVERSRMDEWQNLLREQGVVADQWIPEQLALPLVEGQWSVLVDGDRALVRTGPYSGFVIEVDTLPVLLELMREPETAPELVQLYGATVMDLQDLDVEMVDADAQPLEILARGWQQGPVINLLQDAYSRKEEWSRLLRPWKATAALLLVALILGAVTTGVNYSRLSSRQQQLSADIEALYRKTFPQARKVVNPRAQMEQKLKQLERSASGGGPEFLKLIGEAAGVIRAAKGIEVQGASYRVGRLDLELEAESLQILDQLKQSLDASGHMKAEIQSATTQAGKKVTSRLRIVGAGL
jgi:general secretion pathway protein L